MNKTTKEVYISKNNPGNYQSFLLNVFCCLHEFYALIALDAVAKLRPFVKSHEKWEKDFHKYMNYFISNLAKAIYDYTVLSVLSELRHLSFHSNLELDLIGFSEGQRYEILKWANLYTAESILKTGEFLFDSYNNNWENGYGGYGWEKIAKAGLMYGKVPDLVFIDHCVDLCHNNGSYFDKHLGILTSVGDREFMCFLDEKKHSFNPYIEISKGVSYTFNKLVERAVVLNIIENNKTPLKTKECSVSKKSTCCLAVKDERDKQSFWNVFSSFKNNCYIPCGESYFSEIDLDEIFRYYIHFIFGEKDMTKIPIIRRGIQFNEDGERIRLNERRRGEY